MLKLGFSLLFKYLQSMYPYAVLKFLFVILYYFFLSSSTASSQVHILVYIGKRTYVFFKKLLLNHHSYPLTDSSHPSG